MNYTIEGPDGWKTEHLMPVHHSHWFICGSFVDSEGKLYPPMWKLILPDGRTYQGGQFRKT